MTIKTKLVNGEVLPLTEKEILELELEQAAALAELPISLAKEAREKRDKLLSETDWVVNKAVEQNAYDSLGIQIPLVWLEYRQELRDIPQQIGFPENITWPTKPE